MKCPKNKGKKCKCPKPEKEKSEFKRMHKSILGGALVTRHDKKTNAVYLEHHNSPVHFIEGVPHVRA